MTSVVLEGADLDLVSLAALGVLPSRVEIPVPGYELRPRVNAKTGDVALQDTVTLLDPEGVHLATLTVDEAVPDVHGGRWLAGPLTELTRPEHGAFASLVRSPGDLVGQVPAQIVFVGEPVTDAQLQAVSVASVLLVPLVGHGRRGRLRPGALVRSCLALLPDLKPGSLVVPLPVPVAQDDAEDRLLDAVASAYGSQRSSPARGEESYPPGVRAELARSAATGPGLVVLFSGLSGSGKSTMARALRDRLVEGGSEVTLLDGDVVRRLLSQGLGFSAEDRDLNVRRIGYVAAEAARHGGIAIAAPIAPYARSRAAVREMVEDVGARYLLVHVSTPLEVCEARDRKGLYARARRGEIASFTGVSDPYEVPDDADLVLDTSAIGLEDALDQLIGLVGRRERGVSRRC